MRLSKYVNGAKTTHVWDGSNIVLEYGATNDVYLRGINLIKSDNNGYYLFNAHGDVIQLANASGVVVKNYLYDAFGVEKDKNANDTNPFRYCAEYYDKETSTIYLRNRYYNPALGRFYREDPVRDGLNWYTYCGGNPIHFRDPLGLAAIPTGIGTSVTQSFSTQALASQFARAAEQSGWRVTSNSGGTVQLVYYGKGLMQTTNDFKGNNGKQLGVPHYTQQGVGNNVCWATTSAMVLSYELGDTVNRTREIVERRFYGIFEDRPSEIYNPEDYKRYELNITMKDASGEYVGKEDGTGVTLYPMLTLESITKAIDKGNIIQLTFNTGGSTAHTVLCIGYAVVPGKDSVIAINDPAYFNTRYIELGDGKSYEGNSFSQIIEIGNENRR